MKRDDVGISKTPARSGMSEIMRYRRCEAEGCCAVAVEELTNEIV